MNTTNHRQRAAELKDRVGEALEILYAPDRGGDRFVLSRLLLDLQFAYLDAIEDLERQRSEGS